MSYLDLVLADGAAAYWPLDEVAGTAADDKLGANDGTYAGGITLGQPGAGGSIAPVFGGATGRVTVPDAPALDLGDGPFTMELWYQLPDPLPVGERVLIGKGFGTPAFTWSTFGDQKIAIASDGTAVLARETTVSNDPGVWHALAWTKLAAASVLYRDGVDVTGALTDATLVNTATQLMIGADPTGGAGGSLHWSGGLARVALYPSVLTAAQLEAHYLAGIQELVAFRAIADALAARYTALGTPIGAKAIRSAHGAIANHLPARPCVVVTLDPQGFAMKSGSGSRMTTANWHVRLYYQELGGSDLERDSGQLLEWLGVMANALDTDVDLGGLVTIATTIGGKVGIMRFAGTDYTGLELTVRTVIPGPWTVTS